MEVEYLREMRQNYLMIQAEENQGQGYEAKMMIGNTIEGLLKFRIKKTDNQYRFCYEITSKQPLSRILEKQAISAIQIRKLLLGIARTLTRMEDYLLTEEQILLVPDYIYVDPEEYQPFLCLLPGKKGNFPEEFSLFLQFLLGKADHKDKEAVVLIYGLYRESLKENYGLDNLLRWLMRENYPIVGYRNGDENCERIKAENTNSGSLEKEEKRLRDPERAAEKGKSPRDAHEPRQNRQSADSDRKPACFYFLPGAAMLLLAAGLRFFSGRYKLVPYSIYLSVAGLVLLVTGAAIRLYRTLSDKKGRQTEADCQIFHDPSSCSQLPYEETLTYTSSNSQLFHEQTSFRETSFETSEYNPPNSNPNLQLNAPVQQSQWQMVFQEPEEGNAEEISMPMDSNEEEMRTVLLWNQSEDKTVRRLVSRDGQISILLPYYPFIIGKQEGLCDYVLDKNTVSRLHVRIDETEAGCRVTDLNSTNGTFVNGKLLDANGTALIQQGDEIGVADLKFQLK